MESHSNKSQTKSLTSEGSQYKVIQQVKVVKQSHSNK